MPSFTDVARWDDNVSTANSVSLGSNVSWRGLAVTNPGGAISIGAGNTLTLGGAGIDLSAATQNLTISSGLTLAGGNQTWNIATGRTLTLDTGTFTRSSGATLNIQGTGTVATTMTGLANDATGILGTWATVGTGTDTHYATISGDTLASFTTATTAANFGSVPAGSSGAAVNYDVSAGHRGLGSFRSANTIRYIGATASVSINAGFNMNGLMNVGAGVLTVAGSSTINIGSANELVINAVTQDIALTTIKIAGTDKGLTVMSSASAQVTSNAANTYSGNTAITSGTFALGASGTINNSPVITVYNGATFDVSAKNTAGLTIGETQSLINNGSVIGNLVVDGTTSGSGAVTGTLSGTGSINPGNSSGILSAVAIDSTDLDFNFEFTATGSPDFSNASASKNDVLRLTGATPFASALNTGNAVNIYLNVDAINDGDTFTGGFFIDTDDDFTDSISSATFAYYVADTGGATTYNGVNYSLYAGGLPVSVSTAATLADFADGGIDGQIAQFTFGSNIPEPSTYVLLFGSVSLATCVMRRRRHA